LGLLSVLGLAAEEPVVFQDRFDGKLGEGWTWLRENPQAWRIADGALEIRVEPRVAGTVRNALLRKAPDRAGGKVAIDVTVTFTTPPTQQYEQAGLTWYSNGKPVFKLVHEQIDGKTYIIPGKVPAPEKTARLRLIVAKDRYTAQFQADAKGEFKTVGEGALAPAVALGAFAADADTGAVLDPWGNLGLKALAVSHAEGAGGAAVGFLQG